MPRWPAILVCALISASSASVAAKAPCPQWERGKPYPWETAELKKLTINDRWADIYIDIDETGRPLQCRMGRSNRIKRDDKFWVCKAFLDSWRTKPIMKDGKPVRGTVMRRYVSYSDEHAKALHDARKRVFREHPHERPECYPE